MMGSADADETTTMVDFVDKDDAQSTIFDQ